jgi:hypothetical protein
MELEGPEITIKTTTVWCWRGEKVVPEDVSEEAQLYRSESYYKPSLG